MKLRAYQKELVELALSSIKSGESPLLQADTGSGKTAVLAEIANRNNYVICIAHRNILIKQLSTVLAKFKIKHNVVASQHTQRRCILEHRKLGFNAYSKKSDTHVCSIDSLLSRYKRGLLGLDTSKKWAIVVDEAHHAVVENKWGKLAKIFPNATFVGVTATPCRLDQKSLGKSNGGVFDVLLQASDLKENSVAKLIDMGFLSPFKCFSLPERINKGALKKHNADYTYKSLCEETGRVKFQMAADAVKYYKKLANEKQALAFCVNIEIAKETAKTFVINGIPAAAIHSKLGSVEAARVFDLFEQKEIKVLCNVDMIGEGVDIPAIEALLMLRKTASFGLYRQWVGRSLRPEENKEHAILLDFVGNILEHGLPDKHIDWSLDNPPAAEKSNLLPCPKCRFLNLAWEKHCAECGKKLEREVYEKSKETYIEYLDIGLIELHRRKADEKIKQAQQALEKNTQINAASLNYFSGRGAVGAVINKLRAMCVNHLLTEISISDCNDFLDGTKDTSFWISNFTNSDIKNDNKEKSIKVYKKWLKSK